MSPLSLSLVHYSRHSLPRHEFQGGGWDMNPSSAVADDMLFPERNGTSVRTA